MSLRVKLVLLFLVVGIIPLAAVGVISYNLAQQNIRDEFYSKLEMYSELSEEALDVYFSGVRNDANVMATTRDIYQSFNILAEVEYDTSDPA